MSVLEGLIQSSGSIIAAHAVLRAVNQRKHLRTPADVALFLDATTHGDHKAAEIARAGVAAITEAEGAPLHLLTDDIANGYVSWLADYGMRTARQKTTPLDPEHSKTLLDDLRNVDPRKEN